MGMKGFSHAMDESERISNETNGEDVRLDPFGGRIEEPISDGIEDFNIAAEKIYQPKKDY